MDLSPSELLQYSTLRISTVNLDGSMGCGTGFLYRLCENDQGHIPVLVTNKHVIENSDRGTFNLHLGDTEGAPIAGRGEEIAFTGFENAWIKHPDKNVDLAVMPIFPILTTLEQQGKRPFICTLRDDLIPSDEDQKGFGAVEDILMVGYPIGLSDSTNNFPIFRGGITATHPARDYDGKAEFLIDCACYPGSSGSPVLLYNHSGRFAKDGSMIMGSFIRFLGVLYGGPQYTAEGRIVVTTIPTAQVPISHSRIPANLGAVIKAHLLRDFAPLLQQQATAFDQPSTYTA